MKLEGRFVGLREIDTTEGSADIDFLYGLSMTGDNFVRWRFAGSTPSKELFGHTQVRNTGTLFQAIIYSIETGENIGWVQAFSADPNRQLVHLGIVCWPEHATVGAEGFVLMIEHLFMTRPLRKVRFEVAEYNLDIIRLARLGDLVKVTVDDDEIFYDGQWWALHRCVIYADDWRADPKRNRYLARLPGIALQRAQHQQEKAVIG